MFVEDARRLAAADPPRVLVVPVVDAGFAYTFGAQHFTGLPNEFIVVCSMHPTSSTFVLTAAPNGCANTGCLIQSRTSSWRR